MYDKSKNGQNRGLSCHKVSAKKGITSKEIHENIVQLLAGDATSNEIDNLGCGIQSVQEQHIR